MAFRDDFVPSDGEVVSDSAAESFGHLLEPPVGGGGSDSDIEFVPPGGAAPASSSAGPAASSAGALPALGKQKKCKAGKPNAAAAAGAAAKHALEGEVGTGALRKLVRLASNPKPDSAIAKHVLCITGHPLKFPVPVHPVKVDGRGKQWILLNEHQNWLRRACANTGTTHYEVRFQAAVTALREEFYQLITEARKMETTEGQQGAIRKTLGLSDSEDEPSSRNASRKPPPTRTDIQVNFRGVKVLVLNQHRPLAIECTESAITAVLRACKEKATEHVAASPKPSASAAATGAKQTCQQEPSAPAPAGGTPAPAQPAVPSDPRAFSMSGLSAGIPSKVTWQPSASCWAVHYKDGSKTAVKRVRAKSPKKSSKKFSFNRAKSDCALREETFREACRLWKELDTSKRPRIDLDDAGVR